MCYVFGGCNEETKCVENGAVNLIQSSNFIYLFFSMTNTRPPGPCSDLYKLELPDYYWKRLKTSGNCPPARWHHTACCWNDPSLIAVDAKQKNGGSGSKGRTRSKMSKSTTASAKMVVFGGFSGIKEQRYLNDLWILDSATDTWNCPPPLDPEKGTVEKRNDWLKQCPISRGAHTATIVADITLYIFGGNGGTGFARRDFNDLQVLAHE